MTDLNIKPKNINTELNDHILHAGNTSSSEFPAVSKPYCYWQLRKITQSLEHFVPIVSDAGEGYIDLHMHLAKSVIIYKSKWIKFSNT